MNVRTGELALDVAFQQFDGPPPVALVCSYNGAALPPKARVDGWQRATLLGFESSTTRSYAGGDAGETDSAFSASVFDAWGYPRECGSWVCAADAPSTDPVFLPNCEDYGYRYALRQLAAGRSGPILVYGNPAAVEAVCRGIRRAGLVALRWGVGTWGYGEGRGADQPPSSADCELLQSGNTPGPIAATDLDWLYAPVNVFAAYNGPASSTPNPAPPPVEGDMELLIFPHPVVGGAHFARLVDGKLRRVSPVDHDWASTGPDDELFGVPKQAVDALGVSLAAKLRVDLVGQVAIDVFEASNAATAAGGGSGGAAAWVPTPEQLTALGAAITPHIKVTVTSE